MTRTSTILLSLGLCLTVFAAACGGEDGDSGSSESSGEHDSGESEHDGDPSAGEGDSDGGDGSEEGEESGTQYTKADSYDETRGGAQLLLTYDPDLDAFVGTVTNNTESVLDEVRVEVHLSNGTELGPTTPGDLPPGETADITLAADGEQFTTWSAHPEVGRDEHGDEGDEEHSGG